MSGTCRRRHITPEQAGVNCPDGRWGRRRVRVTECAGQVRAEDVYTALVRDNTNTVAPGAAGTLDYILAGQTRSAGWEVRPNAVWRRGRVFLRCPMCSQRCTRLYLPLISSWLACRRCWGLTYASRQKRNYKDGVVWGGMGFGLTHRLSAQIEAQHESERRREASKARWADRRGFAEGGPRVVDK